MTKNREDFTKEKLISLGITHVTEDGHVFMGEKEMRQSEINKSAKYKKQKPYLGVCLSDKSRKVYNKKYGENWYTYASVIIPVHRAVYAWYHDIIPANYDVDHIDDNRLNNNLSNLQLLTREQNNQKKLYSRNQYTYNLTDEEIAARRANARYQYDRELKRIVKTKAWQEELQARKAAKEALLTQKNEAIRQWHLLVAECKQIQQERVAAKKDVEKWTELGIQLKQAKLKAAEAKAFAQKLKK